MKGKSLLAAIVIVIAALSSFVVWQIGEQQRLAVDNLGYFNQQQDSLVVQYGQTLYWLDADNQLVKALDSNELGLNLVGDYDFFSNGDLLVYHRNQPLSLLDNIKAYLRVSSDKLINRSIKKGDDGFYRCQLANKQCQRFGYQLPLIERGFRVFINQTDDTIYLADTSAFQLYKISQYGRLLASKGEFAFPNQLTIEDNKLWLADTNHHRIVSLSAETDNFATQLSHIETLPDEVHEFPHQFVLHENNIWVNIADNSMSNGLIQQYNRQGDPLVNAKLQHISDPLTMVMWQNKLLVADFMSAQIEQFNQQGQSLGLLSFLALDELLAQREIQKEQGVLISQSGQLAFTITLILGFIVAWKLDGKARKPTNASAVYQQASHTVNPDSTASDNTKHSPQSSTSYSSKPTNSEDQFDEVGVTWLTNISKHYTKKLMLPVLFFFGVISVIITANFSWADDAFFSSVLVTFVIFTARYFYLMSYLSKIKVGVREDNVYLYSKGKRIIAPIQEIFYRSGYLFIGDIAVPIGSKWFCMFKNDQAEQYIFSQLSEQNSMTRNQAYQRLWKVKEPLFTSLNLLFIIMFLGF